MIKVIIPRYISLNNWAAALVADFPNEFLPELRDNNKWEEWGAIVASSGVFERAGIPAPFQIKSGQRVKKFEKWEDWAMIVYNNMANEPASPN